MCKSVILLLVGVAAIAEVAAAEPVWFEGTGHYYEYVDGQTSWDGAVASAELLSHAGLPGHLVTITSEEENEFINVTFPSGESQFFAWIGGSEPNDDGTWLWGSGPESGIQFSEYGTPTPPFYYANWGGIEPNDFNPGEDFAAINLGDEFANVLPGEWIDSPNPNPSDPIHGMVVEYEQETGIMGDSAAGASSLFRSPAIAQPSPTRCEAVSVQLEMNQSCVIAVSIYSVDGRLIKPETDVGVVGEGVRSVSLALGKLPAGVYLVRVEARPVRSGASEETQTLKFVRLGS